MRHESAEGAVDAWERWVGELEAHPLDKFEYEALATRDVLGGVLVIAGQEPLWARADEIDARFQAITLDRDVLGKEGDLDEGWWRRRIPRSEEYQRYLAGDY